MEMFDNKEQSMDVRLRSVRYVDSMEEVFGRNRKLVGTYT
jgi:hypothetical protein